MQSIFRLTKAIKDHPKSQNPKTSKPKILPVWSEKQPPPRKAGTIHNGNPAFFTAHDRKRKAPKKTKRQQNKRPAGGQRNSLPHFGEQKIQPFNKPVLPEPTFDPARKVLFHAQKPVQRQRINGRLQRTANIRSEHGNQAVRHGRR
jgi:hypothetical protein